MPPTNCDTQSTDCGVSATLASAWARALLHSSRCHTGMPNTRHLTPQVVVPKLEPAPTHPTTQGRCHPNRSRLASAMKKIPAVARAVGAVVVAVAFQVAGVAAANGNCCEGGGGGGGGVEDSMSCCARQAPTALQDWQTSQLHCPHCQMKLSEILAQQMPQEASPTATTVKRCKLGHMFARNQDGAGMA